MGQSWLTPSKSKYAELKTVMLTGRMTGCLTAGKISDSNRYGQVFRERSKVLNERPVRRASIWRMKQPRLAPRLSPGLHRVRPPRCEPTGAATD